MMSDDRKQRQLLQHGKKESTFLRLRRTKLGLDDFRTVKVIGKGAFGEVSFVVFFVDAQNQPDNSNRSDWFRRLTPVKFTR
jgi:hypothetical protein